MENLTLSIIPALYLSAIGITLIGIEMLTFSFVLFWFGIAFLLVSGLTLFNVFPDALWQFASIGVISILMLLFLRTKALELFLKSKKENNDNFLNEAGVGTIKYDKVDYKATYWEIAYKGKETFVEGEKVTVLKTEKGFAFIEKIK